MGFAAYCDMLERTIRKLKDGVEDGIPEPDPVLEISVDGYIPDDYIADPRYKQAVQTLCRFGLWRKRRSA